MVSRTNCFESTVAGSVVELDTTVIGLTCQTVENACNALLEGSNGNGNGKEPSPTMQIAVKGLRLFDTLASIFSTIWLIVGKDFCLPTSTYQVLYQIKLLSNF